MKETFDHMFFDIKDWRCRWLHRWIHRHK